ncbi:hypothetical protein K503DRAFT_767463 [Rhizopogon vinicolor AM-OR11-026]|uniref:Uncharacterized protein n=1 Tax=Rhizopogon vinicolor AM-OR11-026 TaxID=1314800 RepID=A0A1B7N9X3_9AGAM|nr:hypothetical protein K503DRAFT_767463 [Rhizopogon vinicolor AM-OR11-026]
MSYDQGNQGSRRNYNDDSNFSPFDANQDTNAGGDSTLSGGHGGSGFGQAGGYTGSQGRGAARQTWDTDNNYSQTDPGMAGNRGVQDTQDMNIPGAGRMGGEQDTGSYGQTVGGQGQGRSRGYERDNDEYDDSGVGQGAGAGRTQKASLGSKVLGGVEKMAGKVTKKPELEGRGEQHQSGF